MLSLYLQGLSNAHRSFSYFRDQLPPQKRSCVDRQSRRDNCSDWPWQYLRASLSVEGIALCPAKELDNITSQVSPMHTEASVTSEISCLHKKDLASIDRAEETTAQIGHGSIYGHLCQLRASLPARPRNLTTSLLRSLQCAQSLSYVESICLHKKDLRVSPMHTEASVTSEISCPHKKDLASIDRAEETTAQIGHGSIYGHLCQLRASLPARPRNLTTSLLRSLQCAQSLSYVESICLHKKDLRVSPMHTEASVTSEISCLHKKDLASIDRAEETTAQIGHGSIYGHLCHLKASLPARPRNLTTSLLRSLQCAQSLSYVESICLHKKDLRVSPMHTEASVTSEISCLHKKDLASIDRAEETTAQIGHGSIYGHLCQLKASLPARPRNLTTSLLRSLQCAQKLQLLQIAAASTKGIRIVGRAEIQLLR
ncbi:uncharacterized protein LOC119238857 [Talpa occidentalis]|uniref:uncharacterized protein LOC119238857 n=1 Tax=Talpa occidentalis TaxID=50954 RepID=UPI0023F9F270|nr:uncharacterized protein LOC119238857 [Talpa occidentalis]